VTLAWSPVWVAADNLGGGVTTYTVVPDGGPLSWVGAYPYLDTADASGSYADAAVNTDMPNYYAAQRFAPSGPITSVSVQWQWFVPYRRAYIFLVDLASTSSFGVAFNSPALDTDGSWHTSNYAIPDAALPALNAALARGDLVAMSGSGSQSVAYQVSFIQLTGTGSAIPLRQVQRDDGLGRSTWRGRGGSSVQRSVRQRGYR